jgi:prevent-host-death family protein
MTSTYNVAEAKAQLSRLLDAALAGEEVIIARAGRPLVRLLPVTPPTSRELGFLPMALPDDLFDPLDGDELAAWS